MSSALVRIIKLFFYLLPGFAGASHFLINRCCLRTHIMSPIFMRIIQFFFDLRPGFCAFGWRMVNSSSFPIVKHDAGHRFAFISGE